MKSSRVIDSSSFSSDVVSISGGSLHYVKAGTGKSTILFIHGFSQDWSEFKEVMSLLSKEYTVVAIDLPGIGLSTNMLKRYDAQSLAEMVHEFCSMKGIVKPYIVGHDMGGMITYAYARQHEDDTSGIALLDSPIPGTPDTDLMVKLPFLWHFAFHRLPVIPEKIIRGREYGYFRKAFFSRFVRNKEAISDADIRRYADAYKEPDQLSAGLGLYRAYRQDRSFTRSRRDSFEVPILIVESDYGSKEPGPTAKQLRSLFRCKNVESVIVKGCGHYMAEENPDKISELIKSACVDLKLV